MALTIVANKALAQRKDLSYEWIDVNNRYLDELLLQYRNVEIGLQDPVLKKYYTLDARKCRPQHELINNIIGDVLIGGMRNGLPTLTLEQSYYRPMLKAVDYVRLAKRNQHPSHEVDASEAEDLIIAKLRKGSRQQCLFTANGFFVRPIHGATDTRLLGACKIMYHNANDTCGVLHMPGKVNYYPFDPKTVEFNEGGDLYVMIKKAGNTPAVVFGGRLFIAGIDKELRVVGKTHALLHLDHTFMMDWAVRYAFILFPGMELSRITAEFIDSVAFKRKLVESEYTFQVELEGSGYHTVDSSVDQWWYREHRVMNYENQNDHYGLLLEPNGRVVDYWGVYHSISNILHHNLLRDDRGARFHAHSVDYMREIATTDKRNRKERDHYTVSRSRIFQKRK